MEKYFCFYILYIFNKRRNTLFIIPKKKLVCRNKTKEILKIGPGCDPGTRTLCFINGSETSGSGMMGNKDTEG